MVKGELSLNEDEPINGEKIVLKEKDKIVEYDDKKMLLDFNVEILNSISFPLISSFISSE